MIVARAAATAEAATVGGGGPTVGGNVFLNEGGKVDVFHHPGHLAHKTEEKQAGPYPAGEAGGLFNDQGLVFHGQAPFSYEDGRTKGRRPLRQRER